MSTYRDELPGPAVMRAIDVQRAQARARREAYGQPIVRPSLAERFAEHMGVTPAELGEALLTLPLAIVVAAGFIAGVAMLLAVFG